MKDILLMKYGDQESPLNAFTNAQKKKRMFEIMIHKEKNVL